MKAKLSPIVYENYKKIISSTILPALGHHKIAGIRSIHIQEFVRMLVNSPVQNRDGTFDKKGKKVSTATVKRKLAVLQSMLTFAMKLGYISYNPADARRLTLPKVTKKEIEIFTKQEASHILRCLQSQSLQFQTLIQLAIYTGAREGELVALKFSDIDFVNQKITISRSAYKLKGEPIRTKPPKSNKSRTLSINTDCIALLKALAEENDYERLRLGTAWVGDEWVFTQWNGEIMHPNTPSRQFTLFLKDNNMVHRKFHSLRHTSATLLLYGGTDLKTVQERLGHADFTTTNKYLHLVDSADQVAVSSLQNMLTTDNT